jgi:hypothetical protein
MATDMEIDLDDEYECIALYHSVVFGGVFCKGDDLHVGREIHVLLRFAPDVSAEWARAVFERRTETHVYLRDVADARTTYKKAYAGDFVFGISCKTLEYAPSGGRHVFVERVKKIKTVIMHTTHPLQRVTTALLAYYEGGGTSHTEFVSRLDSKGLKAFKSMRVFRNEDDDMSAWGPTLEALRRARADPHIQLHLTNFTDACGTTTFGDALKHVCNDDSYALLADVPFYCVVYA